MSINDEIIARWLEIEVSDEEEILNEDTSDVELDVAEDYVLQEDCEYDSEDAWSALRKMETIQQNRTQAFFLSKHRRDI
ncbi:unnamed protein product [Parnassius apollo]|uniref:(apollo) hypothetical protein n=1 Tax=Parnassius apollo TaxID=110799 RepID=A0A8S3WBV5_PARAO|nr:unnamed protein product [Parnassius apollo]